MIIKNTLSSMQDLRYLDRFTAMLNDAQIKKLTNARIVVFGVGGVGSALCHFLVRSGIQNLDIVDYDQVDITNLNRQLVAFNNNIGELKVNALKIQLKDINPNLNMTAFPIKYSVDTQSKINLTDYDIIIDCIDDISAKKLLITNANKDNIYILSCMGAGNRYLDIPRFEIADISKTSYDPIAKILRKFCAEERIKKLDVCYTKQKAIKFGCKKIASVVYYPVNMATVVVAHIIQKIVK